MSKFYDDMSKDERDDWRKHPVTELAFELLREQAQEASDAALRYVILGDDSKAKVEAGKAEGINNVLNVMEHE